MIDYKPGQLLITKRDLFGETDKYGRGFQKPPSMLQPNYTRWQEVKEIGVPKFSVVFVVNVRVGSDSIIFDTMFDDKTISFRCTSLEEAQKNLMVLKVPSTENLDEVDKWCSKHMGVYGTPVTGQVFLPKIDYEPAIKGKYDEIVWGWGRYTFEKAHLEKGKLYIGSAVRRKSSTRTFFFEFVDDEGNYFCKEFRASIQRKYAGQALGDYFVQLRPNNKVPDPNSIMWRR